MVSVVGWHGHFTQLGRSEERDGWNFEEAGHRPTVASATQRMTQRFSRSIAQKAAASLTGARQEVCSCPSFAVGAMWPACAPLVDVGRAEVTSTGSASFERRVIGGWAMTGWSGAAAVVNRTKHTAAARDKSLHPGITSLADAGRPAASAAGRRVQNS